ncbi:MAG: VWA domain-containing protein [bacterium]
MFRFGHTEYLYILYLIPIIIGLFWYILRKNKKQLNDFAEKSLHETIIPKLSYKKFILKFSVYLLAFILAILSLASPQIGARLAEVKQTGIDVFILLDVSKSMLAEDIRPSRLEKAKFEITRLIQKLRGDRIGLIIFSGQAYVQFPLTTDYAAANLFLNAIDENSVPQQGTAIAASLTMALNSFREDAKTEKAIIVISDGEDHEGDIDAAIDDANKKNVKIYTIGLGSPTGAPIPVYAQNGSQSDYKRDREGNIVITKLDETILQELAEKGNGKYFRGSNTEDELELIYNELAKIEKTEFGTTKIVDYEDRYYFLLIPALLLLLIEGFITSSKSMFLERLFRKE